MSAFAAVNNTSAYELTGPSGAPVIVVLGGISAGKHVTTNPAHAVSGWWDGIGGPGCAIDTHRFRVLGIDYLDGGLADDGRPERIVSTSDQADALARVLDAVGAGVVHAVVGASYGGMVALAFAQRYPARVQQLVILGAAHEADPNATAVRTVQRGIVELGLESGRAHEALVLARALAMTTYRGEQELAKRFSIASAGEADVHGGTATFPVERYLRHVGATFARHFAPARFLALSLSADLHRVAPESIHVPTTIVAFEGDRVVPRRQTLALAARLGTPLWDIAHIDVRTPYGHDGFLLETEAVSAVLVRALALHGPRTDFPASQGTTSFRTHAVTTSLGSTSCLA